MTEQRPDHQYLHLPRRDVKLWKEGDMTEFHGDQVGSPLGWQSGSVLLAQVQGVRRDDGLNSAGRKDRTRYSDIFISEYI